MSRNLWFALGFAAAWLVVAALLLIPIINTESALDWLEPLARSAAAPTATPSAQPHPDPSPTSAPDPVSPRLGWTFQGSLIAECERVEIDAARAAH